MRKKIFGVVVMAAIAAAASWNFNQSKNEVVLTDLALANVEALARYEVEVGKICRVTNDFCYEIIDGFGHDTYWGVKI